MFKSNKSIGWLLVLTVSLSILTSIGFSLFTGLSFSLTMLFGFFQFLAFPVYVVMFFFLYRLWKLPNTRDLQTDRRSIISNEILAVLTLVAAYVSSITLEGYYQLLIAGILFVPAIYRFFTTPDDEALTAVPTVVVEPSKSIARSNLSPNQISGIVGIALFLSIWCFILDSSGAINTIFMPFFFPAIFYFLVKLWSLPNKLADNFSNRALSIIMIVAPIPLGPLAWLFAREKINVIIAEISSKEFVANGGLSIEEYFFGMFMLASILIAIATYRFFTTPDQPPLD